MWRTTAIILSVACVMLIGLIAREILAGETPSNGREPESYANSTTTVLTTTTAPLSPLCAAIQHAQAISLSRGGGDPSEVATGLVAVMPEYIEAMRDVLREAENGGIPQGETVFLREAIESSSLLIEDIVAADLDQVTSLIASSPFSEQNQSVMAPTLYALSSGSCRAGLGLRVQ